MCCGCDTSYIVSVHIQFQASIYTLLLCRGHSWRVRLAKQETLTPPGHLVSPLVCRGPWMSTVVLYCWCHSDSASVRLYFTYGMSVIRMVDLETKYFIHIKLAFLVTKLGKSNLNLLPKVTFLQNMPRDTHRAYWNGMACRLRTLLPSDICSCPC